MGRYYGLQRVPHSVPPRVLWNKTRPLVGPVVKSMFSTAVSRLVFTSDPQVRSTLDERARQAGNEVVEKAQQIYFANPGLDAVTIREAAKVGRFGSYLIAYYLRARILLGLDPEGVDAKSLRALPRRGYDALLTMGVAAGESMGYFRGGAVHTQIWWDSEHSESPPSLPKGHPVPGIRRFDPPGSLRDMAADIDDLYWANAYGQSIKVTRVGHGDHRRWLVSLPGTDHGGFHSEPNAADLETNMREELNLPNGMRLGVIESVRLAMAAEGLTEKQMVQERVMFCGHSQGGIIAFGLASRDPQEVGFRVDRVLTEGAPTRRLRLRDDVVAVAVEHDQDIVLSLDGTPRQIADQRVVVRRSVNPPKRAPLFYSHSSSTYTETVRRMERSQEVAPWGPKGAAIAALQDYLPKAGEETRVFHVYTWRDLLTEGELKSWSAVELEAGASSWVPVSYSGEVEGPSEALLTAPGQLEDLVKKLPGVVSFGGGGKTHEQIQTPRGEPGGVPEGEPGGEPGDGETDLADSAGADRE